MEAPSEAPAPSIPSLSQRLDRAKDCAPLVVLVLGAIYAIGWLGESVAIERQGVGMWEVSHQSAVTMGLVVLASVSPLYFLGRFFARLKWVDGRVFLLLWAVGITVAIPIITLHLHSPALAIASAYTFLIWIVAYVCYQFQRFRPFFYPVFIFFLLLVFLPYLYIFAAFITPLLPASLGGFPRNHITILPASNGKAFQGELLGGDSDSIVIFDGEKNVRLSRKEISRIEGAPLIKKTKTP